MSLYWRRPLLFLLILSLTAPMGAAAANQDRCTAALLQPKALTTVFKQASKGEDPEVTVAFTREGKQVFIRGHLKLAGPKGKIKLGILTDQKGRSHIFETDLHDQYAIYEPFTPHKSYRGRPFLLFDAGKIHQAYCKVKDSPEEREAYNQMSALINKRIRLKTFPWPLLTHALTAGAAVTAFNNYGPVYEWFNLHRLDPGLLGFAAQHQSNFIEGLLAMAFVDGLGAAVLSFSTGSEEGRLVPLYLALGGNALAQLFFEISSGDIPDLSMGMAAIVLYGMGAHALDKFYHTHLTHSCSIIR